MCHEHTMVFAIRTWLLPVSLLRPAPIAGEGPGLQFGVRAVGFRVTVYAFGVEV